MHRILQALPYFDRETEIEIRNAKVPVRAHQIVVWVAIAPVGVDDPSTAVLRFPAILDTGHNHNFVITPQQLKDWAGIEWQSLPLEAGIEKKYNDIPVPHRRANIWLFPNRLGLRDEIDLTTTPVLFELDAGIAVYGNGVQVGTQETSRLSGPRLPLIGLRALTANRVNLVIDAKEMSVSLNLPV